MRLKLGVIFGGQSSEYSVSLHSTASFLRQIHEEKYEIIKIGIDTEGHFYVYNGSIDDLEHDHWKKEENCIPCAWVHKGVILLDGSSQFVPLDCVFPVVHGKNCEDGTLQG